VNEDEIQMEDDQLIINDVARAVEEHEFVPYVQPTYELASGKIVAAESFVRWTLPEDGTVVAAALFVPSLERTNTICGLDWYMVNELCAFLGDGANESARAPIALNFSRQHADDPDFAKNLSATADWLNVAHDLMCVEISERSVLEDKRLAEELVPSVVGAGFPVIVDNFSGDADALRSLGALGVGRVKVSASKWRDGEPAGLAELVGAAADASITLVAEGIESDGEASALIEAGIAFGQGFGLAKPMGLEEYVKLF
jgi:EAL domain-containing protein (putative c-di-GMP-specific phosphodiesterase class I)